MLKTILAPLTLPLLMLFSNGADISVNGPKQQNPENQTGTLEKMIVASGNVTMDVDLSRLNGSGSRSRMSTLRFEVVPDSFFTVLVFNNELRGPLPSSMGLIPQNSAALPAALSASYHQLIVESTPWGEEFELVVRDAKTGFVFFNIEGHSYDYAANEHLLGINDGRLLISKEFAARLGRPAEAGSIVGKISVAATMRAIEITKVVNGEVKSDVLPANRPSNGSVPGPDVIVGDLNGLSQPDTGSVGTQVGISVGTDSCNIGVVDLDWFQTPDNDHPVIPQNLYRMSGGATNDDRFEQIGQSSVKHAFTALTQNICSLGCNGVGGTHLGSGCSDPYVVSLNSGGSTHNLGSRAWINPFKGVFPRADSATPPNSHTGHTHNAISHRMLVEIGDLNTSLNTGASYYAEAQYITPHEYVWCQAHAGQCNMYNNVSYRRYVVTGTASPFSFGTSTFTTVRMKSAVTAWTGATINQIEPDPGNDGIGSVSYKVTNPSQGVWHYEYAIYNQNLDRAIQSFSVPLGTGINVSNIGFHAPPQQPGSSADGTVGNTGFSSTPWTATQTASSLTWSSETFAQNQNANAIRWGTMYNVRFDSDRPPQTVNATVGFLKTGAPIQVQVQGPTPLANPSNVQFSSASYNAGEGDGSTTVTVTRGGDTSGAVTVGFATSDGTAQQRKDYTVASGTLSFAAGETSKTFSVSIVENAFIDGSRTLNLNLSGPTGGAVLGATNTATLAISDNDASGATLIINGQPVLVRRFFGELSGTQETPSNASAGNGSGMVLLNSAGTSAMVGLQFANLGSAQTAAHIHTGAIGVAGPITFPLTAPADPVTDFSIGPTSPQVTDLKAGSQYLNVHSSNLPNGEIRGQLLWNPTLEDSFFVRQHYLDFLNREPSASDLAFWTGQIHCPQGVTGDQADVQCYHDRTVGVSNAFYFSNEFQLTASFVYLGYRSAYGNTQPFPNTDPGNPTEANKLPNYDVFSADRPKVLGGANLAQQQLAFMAQFVTRTEFVTKYPASLNSAALFVDAVLANILAADGVTLSATDRSTLLTQYTNAGGGNAGRAMVMWHLSNDYWNTCSPGTAPCVPAGGFGTAIDNRAFIDAEYNRQFALILYFGYLRRNPEIGGFIFWQNKINEAPVRNVPKQNSLVCSFITSGEYEGRFGAGTTFGAGLLFPRGNSECPP